MRILQISSAQSLGGGERHLADLANGLASRGHEVYLALRPESPLADELKKIPKENITTLPLRNSLDAVSARALATLVRRNKIQIVHAHMARDYPLASYAVRKNQQARLVVTRHVLFSLNRLHRVTLSKARLIAVSEGVAAQLRSEGIAPAERISVVLNGIDVDRFVRVRQTFNREQFLRQWKLPEDSVLVGTVGELTPLKGQAEFLKAAVLVTKRYPNAHFIIAGTDNSPGKTNTTVLEDLIRRLNLTERVTIVPWLADISQLYSALDIFVSASHTESFGLAIAEAMASSTAVIATKTAGATEIIQPGMTGLLVSIGDPDELAEALMVLLRDRHRRRRMGAAAQHAVAETLNMKRMLDETEKIYLEEVQESASTGEKMR